MAADGVGKTDDGEAVVGASSPPNSSPYFLTLVQSLATAALQQMGKIAHPFTQKVERSLPEAKVTIDMLAALKEKTAGNLSPEETRAIGNALATLQLNYVEESRRQADPPSSPPTAEQQ